MNHIFMHNIIKTFKNNIIQTCNLKSKHFVWEFSSSLSYEWKYFLHAFEHICTYMNILKYIPVEKHELLKEHGEEETKTGALRIGNGFLKHFNVCLRSPRRPFIRSHFVSLHAHHRRHSTGKSEKQCHAKSFR